MQTLPVYLLGKQALAVHGALIGIFELCIWRAQAESVCSEGAHQFR